MRRAVWKRLGSNEPQRMATDGNSSTSEMADQQEVRDRRRQESAPGPLLIRKRSQVRVLDRPHEKPPLTRVVPAQCDKAAWLAANGPVVEAVPPRERPESIPIRDREAVWDLYVENIEVFREGALEHVELAYR